MRSRLDSREVGNLSKGNSIRRASRLALISRNALAVLFLSHSGSLMQVGVPPRALSPYPASSDHSPPAWFVNVAAEAGITARNVNGSVDSKRYIIESTGSGVAIIDYDRDG